MFETATVGLLKPFDKPDRWSKQFQEFIARATAFKQEERATAQDLLGVRLFFVCVCVM
jgi:hypothetical protein